MGTGARQSLIEADTQAPSATAWGCLTNFIPWTW